MRGRSILAFVVGVFLLAGGQGVPATAQSSPPFRLLIAGSPRRLQAGIEEWSARYAVAFGLPAGGLAVLRRLDASEPASSWRVPEGRVAIERALAERYRALRGTLDIVDGRVALIARTTGEAERWTSLLLGSRSIDDLERQMQQARTKGLRIIGMASGAREHWALFEGREPQEDAVRGAFLVSGDPTSLEVKLARRAGAGYRIAQTSAWRLELLSLEHPGGTRPPVRRFEYRVLSAGESRAIELQMNLTASQGFRYTADTMRALRKFGLGWMGGPGSQFVVVMETDRRRPPCQYRVIAGRRATTLEREFDAAVGEGFVPVGLTVGVAERETLVLLERR